MGENKILNKDMEHIAHNFKGADIFQDKKILITGCAGFLGFYISSFFAYLMENGVDIAKLFLLDNFILNNPSWIKDIQNGNSRIKVNTFDVSKDDIKSIPLAEEADYVIHMASIASPTYYRKYPIQTIDANVWGLRNLLEFYKKLSLKGFLFFSSSEVYGDPLDEFMPISEEYRGNVLCIGPRACYDEAKRFGETLCYIYTNVYKMPIRIVRPFNNYGPGMNLGDGRVPADFARSVLTGKDITIYSDGTPTRTFCYVADAIVGYLKALTHNAFDYFNIGMERPEISINDLAGIYKNEAKDLLGYKSKIVYKTPEDKDYLTDNPLRRCPDTKKARELLDFTPKIEIREGIRRFLEYLIEEKMHI